MPRYLVQRTFPKGLETRIETGGVEACREVIVRNAEHGVTWLHSYVSDNKRTAYCVYDAPSPEAIRQTAIRNQLPVDQIARDVRELWLRAEAP